MRKRLKLVALMVVGSVVGFSTAGPVNAASTGEVTVTVTITNLSLTIADGGIAFGNVSLGDTVVSPEKQVVTNNGNIEETYTIQLTGKDLLTVGETETGATDNTFVLQALFTGDGAAAPNLNGVDHGADGGTADDVLKFSTAQTASATTYAWTGSTETGASVSIGGVRDLYLKYSAPTTDSVTSGAQEDLTFTVAATAS